MDERAENLGSKNRQSFWISGSDMQTVLGRRGVARPGADQDAIDKKGG
jgi:hypothetical protein